TVLSQNRNQVSGNMLGSRKQIVASALPHLELHYTEWSASYTPTDPIHDSYHEAAYILNTVKWAAANVNSMSYWTFTDIFEESGPRATPFHGGFGLINYQDIKKPAYYAYQYLNQLGDKELINTDSSAIICKDALGNLQALVWDFTIDHPGDSVNNQIFYKRNLPAKTAPTLRFKVDGLKPGKYLISIFQTGYGINDPYSAYYKLGSPLQLTRDQVQLLKQQNNEKPVQQITVIVSASGRLEKLLPMHQNDVFLMKITKV
ncbi:MAG: GH39 family glycosyl hydrolase, partial [Janthinobacterium lividum]